MRHGSDGRTHQEQGKALELVNCSHMRIELDVFTLPYNQLQFKIEAIPVSRAPLFPSQTG